MSAAAGQEPAAQEPPSPEPPARESVDQSWPGQRLGLPRTGPGAVAGWGRRVLAIFIDWVASSLAVSVFTGHSILWPTAGLERWLPLTVFAVETIVLTATLGGSAGQLVTRVQVRRLRGARLDPLRATARTALICLVIPAVIYNSDQRGLHDLVVDSIAVRR